MVPALPHGVRILLALLLTGCVVGSESSTSGGEPADPSGSGSGVDPTDKPIPTNGLVLDVALAAQLPTGALGAVAGNDVVVSNALFETAGGKELMKYVAICALPSDQTLVVGGERFDGFYGLAKQWPTAGCSDLACQRWVSACLLAHANATGTPVAISLRADTVTTFALEAQQQAGFTYQEAAYYGNVFQHELFACMGSDTFYNTGGGADSQKFADGRICGLGACGLVGTGICAPIAPPYDTGACDHQPLAGGGYADCHVGAQTETAPRTSPTYHEVVTVYLTP